MKWTPFPKISQKSWRGQLANAKGGWLQSDDCKQKQKPPALSVSKDKIRVGHCGVGIAALPVSACGRGIRGKHAPCPGANQESCLPRHLVLSPSLSLCLSLSLVRKSQLAWECTHASAFAVAPKRKKQFVIQKASRVRSHGTHQNGSMGRVSQPRAAAAVGRGAVSFFSQY